MANKVETLPPNYTPTAGVGTKEKGYTYTDKGWQSDPSMDSQITSDETAINSDNLAPTSPINVTPPAPSTGSAGLNGMTDATTKTFEQGLAEKSKAAETAKDTAYKALLSGITGADTQSGLESDIYGKGGVDTAEAELKDINNQILAEKNALNNQIEAIRKSASFGPTADREIARLTRDSTSKQADLAIIQMSKQGKYDSAKTIADRQVDAKLEEQKNKLAALELTYNNNKDLFTTAERRDFEAAQAERKREYDREEAKLKEISELSLVALKNGAPVSTVISMRNAKTAEDAMKAGGSFVSDKSTANNDYNKALQFIKDNPNASRKDLEDQIRANTKLDEAEIKAVLGGKQFLTEDFFKQQLSYLSDEELKTKAKEAGGRGFWSSWKTEKENYLKDESAKIFKIVGQYREAGYTDEEILKLMQ